MGIKHSKSVFPFPVWEESMRRATQVGSDKADDDKAEGIDDKFLTSLAHVFRPGPSVDI